MSCRNYLILLKLYCRIVKVLKFTYFLISILGDIIKATLGKARENNKVNCAKSMAESLIIKFKEIRQLQNNESVINRATVEFHSLKELAKRFALSFGLDALKNREAVTSLHREGILLAVNPLENPDDPTAPPPNLSFLEILTEFSNKLLKQDKKVVLNYLDKRIEGATPSRLVYLLLQLTQFKKTYSVLLGRFHLFYSLFLENSLKVKIYWICYQICSQNLQHLTSRFVGYWGGFQPLEIFLGSLSIFLLLQPWISCIVWKANYQKFVLVHWYLQGVPSQIHGLV